MNYFSSNIKVLRKQSGLRQSQIQERLGIARTTWSNYENGISQPSIDGLINIAHFFSVSVSDLLEKDMNSNIGIPTRRSYEKYNRLLKSTSIQSVSNRGLWERTSTW